ncbi:Dad2p NDAI_0A03180 [Naumovozyma dairenensis CBS 421]|uniref:DASH complex subunit DAD2 n=1 Tax=Naumovozyma dairenensis (strain ATCC 10597 / BCRC 20456 / CBS 421 / NBRC 0211 / NRRL Y-12639) TaxID=1071378 RepID=G0W3T7_NAUDC|nr:hypothetical protein NDAI_0A03180 [Naumovozyma dairenensis CBS 421]CCD22475.1 hypothetical protein NDAI_0A03180 [Naumovozyma dairenensis CBS 421]
MENTELLISKQRELEALKKITTLTDNMKIQLDELSIQVSKLEHNASVVGDVTSIWDSVLKSISQASLGLLQYSENDYEVGVWNNNNESRDDIYNEDKKTGIPLPETLVRIRATTEDEDLTQNEPNEGSEAKAEAEAEAHRSSEDSLEK